jgi:hypothetical protein
MRYELNKGGIEKLKAMMEKRFCTLKKEASVTAFEFLINFGYHAVFNPQPYDIDKGWTWYYAANWNVGVGSIDRSVIVPKRPVDHKYPEEYRAEWSDNKNKTKDFSALDIGKTIYVTNSVYYGKWLNDGGFQLRDTFWIVSKPNRFIEQCESHLSKKLPGIIRKAKTGG